MNITDLYHQHSKDRPEHPAIVTDRTTISYREWNELVRRTSASFAREPGVHRRVAIFLPNGHLFLQVFAGASRAGWSSIIGDVRWKQQEMEVRLSETEPDLIIAERSKKGMFENLSAKLICAEDLSRWSEYHEETPPQTDGEDPFYIGFTSGSTGKPKAFIRSHKSWVETFRCSQQDLGITQEDHILIPGSFVNSTFLYGALSTLYIGGTVYILPNFSASRLVRALEEHPISVIYTVPTMIQATIDERWSSSRRVTFMSTGAKLLPDVKRTMKERFPQAAIHEFYGASELSFVSLLKDDTPATRNSSVGSPVHNVEVSIRKEDGTEAVPGEIGKLYVKSSMLFNGYLKNEEETRKVKTGEWATVHDFAKMDEDGYVYIVGRSNDMIIYGGINIYPQEIEETLKHVEGIDEVVVCGVKDSYWGEKVAACIRGSANIKELKSYALSQLTAYKIPRIWKKVDSFPYTSGGKISRNEIRRWLEEEFE
ncbi:AMP-binding protein [Salimicrobium flavidum]|uniref:Long-chain acyl-CoA synthetase n=1 Tax=Salimicrobium flavidum TaxID=570947 RepID=A0A1N7J317_9BACI|nr:AMP-binding protein [Salimicrobium flavidum]SIS43740.1 long-chain acyl-CoA synthetase [Salimicrobium flavidum]